MRVLLQIAIIFMRIIYFFIKIIFRQKNIITMISRQSNNISVDFKLLSEKIESNKKYKVVILTKKLNPGFRNKISYLFHMFKQMYYLSISKCVILDSYCITVSVLKHKKNLVVIQIWHAMGSLKKFGFSVLETDPSTSAFSKTMSPDKKVKLSNIMKMHRGYDYIFTSCKTSLPYFAEAFNYPLGNMIIMPLPVVDLLNSSDYKKKMNNKVKNEIKMMKKKKNIVYVPTFRPEEKEEYIQSLIDSINYEKYNLIIKLHPLTKLHNYDNRVIWDKKFSSLDIMIASDYIITDYSAIVYEAALLDKPIFFYTYDYDSYVSKRNFYIDYKREMPGTIEADAKKIINLIETENYSIDKIRRFRKKYIEIPNKGVCNSIYELIDKEINKKNRK